MKVCLVASLQPLMPEHIEFMEETLGEPVENVDPKDCEHPEAVMVAGFVSSQAEYPHLLMYDGEIQPEQIETISDHLCLPIMFLEISENNVAETIRNLAKEQEPDDVRVN